MTNMLVVVDTADDAGMAIEGGADRVVLRVATQDGSVDDTLLQNVGRCAEGKSSVSLWLTEGAPTRDIVGIMQTAGADELRLSIGEQGLSAKVACPDELRRIGVVTADVPMDAALFDRASADGLSGLVIGDGVQPRRLLHMMTIGQLQRARTGPAARAGRAFPARARRHRRRQLRPRVRA